MADRREALKIIGAIGTTCAFPYASDELYGQHVHPLPGQANSGAPRFFAADEMALIARLADLIIPETSTPGAVAAGVPAYIDLVVSSNPEHQRLFKAGLAWLVERKFGELGEHEQIALLTPLCEAVDAGRAETAPERFFRAVKSMTADGYYTSRIGMTQELGFKGGAVLARYPACEVPEH